MPTTIEVTGSRARTEFVSCCGASAAPAVYKALSSTANAHRHFQNNPQCSLGKDIRFRQRKISMRLGQAIFLGSAAALLTLAAPTLARNASTNAPPAKATEAPASASCHAYQQAADGSWTQLPCQEMGSKAPAQPRSAAKGAAEETQ
jgi:hypothetical protein